MLLVSRVRGHKEWAPRRKSDPAYDMSWRRARVAAFVPRGGDWFDMATEADLRRVVAEEVRAIYDTLTPGKAGVKFHGDVWAKVTDTQSRLLALQGEVAALRAEIAALRGGTGT